MASVVVVVVVECLSFERIHSTFICSCLAKTPSGHSPSPIHVELGMPVCLA